MPKVKERHGAVGRGDTPLTGEGRCHVQCRRRFRMALRGFILAPMVATLAVVSGCAALGDHLKWAAPEKIVWTPPTPFPIGSFEFNFAKERERAVASAGDLPRPAPSAPQEILRFSDYEFTTGPLPEGCNSFEAGRFKTFRLTDDAFAQVRKRVEDTKKQYGWVPDDMALAFSMYEATAFRSVCGPEVVGRLQPGSKINGWQLTEEAARIFQSVGQMEVRFQPSISIMVLSKKEFDARLKPTAANLLISRYRFEIPPNYDSLVSDPQTGSAFLTYTEKLEDIRIGAETNHHIYGGGIVRIFTGKTYIYMIEIYAFTPGISEKQWESYRKYADSIRYVGEGKKE